MNDECLTLNVKRGLQTSASGGGIGAGNAFTALAIRVRQIDLGKLPKIHIGIPFSCLPRQLASLWEEHTREGRTSNSASIRVLVLLQEALLYLATAQSARSIKARATARTRVDVVFA